MNVSGFLKEVGFDLSLETQEAVTTAFEGELRASLAGEVSSLKMLPSHIRIDGKVNRREPVAVIDAGGTNLRVAKVSVSDALPSFDLVRRTAMPGSHGELSADAFHRAIAREVDAVLSGAPELRKVGYCFSYECQSLPDGDAILNAWAKQISAPEVVGQAVGAELVCRLSKPISSVRVLNDTTATLLAGRARAEGRAYSGYLGFILGTGTNVACVEDGMIRNAESGECDKVPRSAVDLAVDAGTSDTGHAIFEKMVSGAYLGRIGLQMFRMGARAGFLRGTDVSRLNEVEDLTARELDEFAAGLTVESLSGVFSGESELSARNLAVAVFQRAALFTAGHLVAFLRRVESSRGPVQVVVDGSTYWNVRSVRFDRIVRETIASSPNVPPFEIVRIEDAPMVGAAVAACLEGE